MMRRNHFVYALAFVMAQCACASGVAEPVAQNEMVSKLINPSDLSNIGFMKKPPKEYIERFPMCDAFLDVKWIDKKKMIGYMTYEAIRRGKGVKHEGERVRMWSLVDMRAHGFDYDVYQYVRNGELEEIFEAVRKGSVVTRIPMLIKYNGKMFSLYGGGAINDDALHPLLSDYLQNVCVVYPDSKHAWIIEKKKVDRFYTKVQLDKLTERVRAAGINTRPDMLGSFMLLDINFDGVDDYVADNSYYSIYSLDGVLYTIKIRQGQRGIDFAMNNVCV